MQEVHSQHHFKWKKNSKHCHYNQKEDKVIHSSHQCSFNTVLKVVARAVRQIKGIKRTCIGKEETKGFNLQLIMKEPGKRNQKNTTHDKYIQRCSGIQNKTPKPTAFLHINENPLRKNTMSHLKNKSWNIPNQRSKTLVQ